jgi:hypothetical protein
MAIKNFTRLSPGVYRSPTGQLTRSSTMPTVKPQQPASNQPVKPPQQPATEPPVVATNDRPLQIRRYQEAVNRIGTMQTNTDQYNKNAQIIKDVGNKYGFNWQKHIGKDWAMPQTTQPTDSVPAENQPTTPQQSATQTNSAPTTQEFQSPMTKSLLDALRQGTNTMQAYEPKFFDGSPLYQFQKQKGLADMERLMAARGLTNSGAEIQANSDFLANINAQEAEKQRQFADQQAQRNQNMMQFIAQYDQGERQNLQDQLNTDLARQVQQQQFEAGRQDNRQRLMTDFLSNVLQMQSNNPIPQLAYSGLNQQSGYTQALMKAIAGNLANNYPRVFAGGGGSGPLPPSGGNLDIMQILMNYGNTADNNSTLDGLLRQITGG